MSTLLIPKHQKLGEGFSKGEIFKSFEHPGRQTVSKGTGRYQSPATWILDHLVPLKKCILLCSYCRVNFNHVKHHYRKHYVPDQTGTTDGYVTNGVCDACKVRTENTAGGVAYIHESYFQQVNVDPAVARRNARAAAKAWSVTKAIRR